MSKQDEGVIGDIDDMIQNLSESSTVIRKDIIDVLLDARSEIKKLSEPKEKRTLSVTPKE